MRSKTFTILGWMLCVSIAGCDSQGDQRDNIIVIVKYKTLPNKSIDAVVSLKRLIEKVKEEDHFVKIILHVDQSNNSNILLYEEWDDELYYRNQHMKTEHLRGFQVGSQEFLEGPPEISYWKKNAVYE